LEQVVDYWRVLLEQVVDYWRGEGEYLVFTFPKFFGLPSFFLVLYPFTFKEM
jgi:hypothetical protein